MDEYVTPLKAGLKWAIYLSLISIAMTLAFHYTGFSNMADPEDPNGITATIINLVISIGATVLAQLYYRKHNEGLMTYGEGISVAFFLGIFSGLVMALFMYLFMSYIEPGLSDAIREAALQDESMSDEEREMAGSIIGAMTSPTALAFISFFTIMLTHVIIGLITSIFIKKD